MKSAKRHLLIPLLVLGFILSLIFSFGVLANPLIQQEIDFREDPQSLYLQQIDATQFPFDVNEQHSLDQQSKQLKLTTDELLDKLILLARLTLEKNVKSDKSYHETHQLLDIITPNANSVLMQAKLIMLNARLSGLETLEYKPVIQSYNKALSLVDNDTSTSALLFKYTLHEHLSELHMMALESTPALTHLNRYRELAYQLRSDYLIAKAEMALGLYYNRLKNHAKSLQHYNEAFRVGSRIKYPAIRAHALLYLARTYRDLGQAEDALKYAYDAASAFQRIGFYSYEAEALTVIAVTYASQKEWNKAIDHHLNALQLNEQLNNIIAQGLSNHHIAEAYYHLDDFNAAQAYVSKANAIFNEKKLPLYLVFNENLYAQILLKLNLWDQAIVHANKSLIIAKDKALIEQEIEALKIMSQAYREQGDFVNAISLMDKLVTLGDNISKDANTNESQEANLTEQKLKFELNLLQSQLQQKNQTIKDTKFILTLVISMASLLLVIGVLFLSRSFRKVQSLGFYQSYYFLDPISELNGMHAALSRLDDAKQPEFDSLALIQLTQLSNNDIDLGTSESQRLQQKLINELSQFIKADIYVIKPGLYLCGFNQNISVDALLQDLEVFCADANIYNPAIPSFNRNMARAPLYIGFINLPLSPNPDIKVSAALHLETLQYALAMAKTQPISTYVSFKVLNFAPAAIFSQPIYLNVTQALKRGMLRLDSNRNINEEHWPR